MMNRNCAVVGVMGLVILGGSLGCDSGNGGGDKFDVSPGLLQR